MQGRHETMGLVVRMQAWVVGPGLFKGLERVRLKSMQERGNMLQSTGQVLVQMQTRILWHSVSNQHKRMRIKTMHERGCV